MTSPTTSAHPHARNAPISPHSSDDERRQQKNKDMLPLSETDPKAAKQKAAEDKLQLLSTIQGLQQGRMPHNAQLEELLTKLINNKVITSREHLMSADGQTLLKDFRKLLQTVQKALVTKNKDELFQSLVYHFHCMESPMSEDQLNDSMKVTDSTNLKREGKQASEAMYKIGKLILINNEFRSLLGELLDISQDIFSNVTSKVGESLSQAGSGLQNDENQPDKSGRRLVDKVFDKVLDPNQKMATGDNKNEQRQGRGIHDQEPHIVSASNDDPRHQGLLNTGDSLHPKAIPGGLPGSLEKQEEGTIGQQQQLGVGGALAPQSPAHDQQQHQVFADDFNQPIHSQQVGGQQQPYQQDESSTLLAHQQQPGALGHSQRQPYDISNVDRFDPLQQQQRQGDFDQGINPTDAHNLGGTSNEFQQKIENHPTYQNAKAEMYSHKDHAHATFKENLPKEKQDELLHRLKLVVAQIQKHPDYESAIETLVQLVKVWSNRISQVTNEVKSNAKEGGVSDQATVKEQAERELKAIIEIWAQGQSIDPLLHGVQEVTRDMQQDEHLRDFYHQVVNYTDRLIREPGFVADDRSTEEGERLMDRGRELIRGKYKDHLNHLSSECRRYMNLMAEDDISKELNHRIATIHRDLWMDSEGNPAFKPQLLDDMKQTLLPAFIDEIKYIPVPRIEYSDPQYDISIENLVISGDTLLPNTFETKFESFNSISLRTDTASKPSSHSFFVRMSEIQAEIDDVVFFYKKKSGFPKLSDRGVASLHVGGKGITLSLRIHSVANNPAVTFKVTSCKCNVDNLKVKVNDSKHDILYKAIHPILVNVVRKQVAKTLEHKVTAMLMKLDNKITTSIVEMNQNLQTKAYNALPEDQKANTEPPTVSQARNRPGFFSTIVKIINNNIKTKVQQRNEAKRMEGMSMSQAESESIHSKTEPERGNTEFGANTNMPSNEASIETGRHNSIVSPPLSPTQKKRDITSADNNLMESQELENAQQDEQKQQFRTTQI